MSSWANATTDSTAPRSGHCLPQEATASPLSWHFVCGGFHGHLCHSLSRARVTECSSQQSGRAHNPLHAWHSICAPFPRPVAASSAGGDVGMCIHGGGLWDMARLWLRYHHSHIPSQQWQTTLHCCMHALVGDDSAQQGSGFPQ